MSFKTLVAGAAILTLAACSSSPKAHTSYEKITSQLTEMGYQKDADGTNRWSHNPPASRQEAPRVHIYKDDDGWRVDFVDFDVFYCRPTARLSPREAVQRSKDIFATVPAKDRVAVPNNPERGEIEEKDLLCHVGRGG